MSTNIVFNLALTFPTAVEPPDHREYLDTGIEWRDAELWFYRERTTAILKQYLRFAIEVGRLPSILGREFFRAKISYYRVASFEDTVIFVHDVERALEHLPLFHQQVVAAVVFQDYSHEQAADVLRCARRTVSREFPLALDSMSEMFLEGGLLTRLPAVPVEKTCQEANEGGFELSDCKQAE